MLDNSCYNKIKLIHDLSSLLWFIKKHAHEDAHKVQDSECANFLKTLEQDLSNHVETLKHMVCK
jgi:hypothetical protein